jgi:hypothetical protein
MLTVITFALAVGLLGGWVYAGCPLPARLVRKPVVGDEAVGPAPVPGASTARP